MNTQQQPTSTLNPGPVKDGPDLPSFLRAEKGKPRPEMKDSHRLAVLQLTKAEALRIWDRCHLKDPNFPSFQSGENESDEGTAAKGLLLTALKYGNGQAELVMACMRDKDPITDSIAEKLTGKPITHVPERGAHAPRTQRPTKTRAAPQQSGDDQIIRLLIATNPRKAGTSAFLRYALYRDGMTVGEYAQAGGQRSNVQTDVARGSIKLETPTR